MMSEQPKWVQNKLKYNAKYRQENYKQVNVRFRNDYYNDTLLPLVEASGETIGVYVKNAVEQRIERERGE